jgi:signal transduction histidine kinase
MKIMTSTQLALVAALTSIVAFAMITFMFYRTLDSSAEQRRALYSVVQGVAELHIRTDELMSPNRFDLRPLRQWKLRDAALQATLMQMHVKGETGERLLASLIARHHEIRRLFDRLVQLQIMPDNVDLAYIQQQRLLGRLFVMFEEQVAEADDLMRVTLESDATALNRTFAVGAALLLLLLGAVVLAVATVRRGMSAPLDRLLRATDALGAGRLEHRIGSAPENEIGTLSRAVDTMAERLQTVTSSRDDLKQVEEALRRLNETLEERVGARTAELEHTHEQLRQAQKMEAVGQLTGGIAHDFNNLLAGIVGNLELMRVRLAQGRTGDLARYINSMMAVTNRASSLTHRLLAFSRRQTLDPKATDIGKLVLSMQDLIGRTVGPAIRLSMNHDDDLWLSLCDAHQLESALLNLAINARDAMPEGGRLMMDATNVIVDDGSDAAQADLAPGQYVAITVSDTGTGMPPDVLARVFDPFFTTKPIGQGTGLGLSMIYGFVKQSGGHIRIDSRVGAGTKVWIYLPRYAGMLVEAAPPEPVDPPRAADANITVLVVDDDTQVRISVAEMLDELGYTTIQAATGHEGLQVLRTARHLDLMITDVGLPGGMNGCQLANEARMLRTGLKILFITGYIQNADLGSDVLEHGTEVLTKPFGLDTFASKVRGLIEPVSSYRA